MYKLCTLETPSEGTESNSTQLNQTKSIYITMLQFIMVFVI